MVVTQYDHTVDFGALSTFAIAPTMSFITGTLIVEMIDLRGSRSASAFDGSVSDTMGPRLEVGWAAIVHGYGELDASFRPDVPAAIAQAFAQSPYLRARK